MVLSICLGRNVFKIWIVCKWLILPTRYLARSECLDPTWLRALPAFQHSVVLLFRLYSCFGTGGEDSFSSIDMSMRLIPTLAIWFVQSANDKWIMHTASGLYKCQCAVAREPLFQCLSQSSAVHFIKIESLVVIIRGPIFRGNSNTR